MVEAIESASNGRGRCRQALDDTDNLPATLAHFDREYGPAADDDVARFFGVLRYFSATTGNLTIPSRSSAITVNALLRLNHGGAPCRL